MEDGVSMKQMENVQINVLKSSQEIVIIQVPKMVVMNVKVQEQCTKPVLKMIVQVIFQLILQW